MKSLEQRRIEAAALCAQHGVQVVPYAGAWWLLGKGINRVLGELAGLRPGDLTRLQEMPRAGRVASVRHERAGYLRLARIAEAARRSGIAREAIADLLDISRRHFGLPPVERRGRRAGCSRQALNSGAGLPE